MNLVIVVRLMSEAKAEVEAEKVFGVIVKDVRLVIQIRGVGIRGRRSEMHQTSEGHDSTRFSSFPQVSLRSPLRQRAPLSCSTRSSEQCQALRRLLEIGGMAKGGLSTPSRILNVDFSRLTSPEGSCDRQRM
jgi:hypothetical protein